MPGGPPPSEGQRGLAKAVRELRGRAELSQDALAERAGLPPAAVTAIESGDHDPVWGNVRRVAEALGVSLEALSELAETYELDREV